MMTEDIALKTSNLKIGYRLSKGRESVIADGLTLEMRRGELVCLLGPNGAGKSTLIRSLAGVEESLSGSIELDGKDVSLMEPKERARSTSVVLTDTVPSGLFTAFGLVALGRHPHTRWTGGLSAIDYERIEWALGAVGAEDLAQRHFGELSDGERQKVLIARALAQEAKVLLLDEPTAFVDLPRRVELMRILSDLAHQERISVLLSSHDLELSLRCADRLWVMGSGGQVVAGIPEELALSGQIAQAFESDKIDWDVEQGGFRLHRAPTQFASVEGDGELKLWTCRALARLGYGIRKGGEVELKIKVGVEDGGPVWWVNDSEEEHRFSRLKRMVKWLEERVGA